MENEQICIWNILIDLTHTLEPQMKERKVIFTASVAKGIQFLQKTVFGLFFFLKVKKLSHFY